MHVNDSDCVFVSLGQKLIINDELSNVHNGEKLFSDHLDQLQNPFVNYQQDQDAEIFQHFYSLRGDIILS